MSKADGFGLSAKKAALLAPWGKRFHAMSLELGRMKKEELKVLRAAAASASTTNCWAWNHDAAKWLLAEIDRLDC